MRCPVPDTTEAIQKLRTVQTSQKSLIRLIVWHYSSPDYSADVLVPPCQCVTNFALILRSIIHSRHSGLVTAYVVQHRLNYIWQDSKPVGHHCGTGSAEVVETPKQA